MTPQRWKGAGAVFLVIAALLILGALFSVLLTSAPGLVPYAQYQFVPASAANLFGLTGVFRGVVLGAFAGVAFFLGLACFAWSALREAHQQRAEILDILTALRLRAEKTD